MISVSIDSRSSESIILLPNTERCAALNFMAMWNQSRILPRASWLPWTVFSNSPASSLITVTRSSGHTVSTEELIESRCSRGDFPVHIGIELWRAVGERRSPGDEVDVATKASLGVAMPQPRRVDAHGSDMAGFANLDGCNGLRQFRDVTLDVSVELFSQ